MPNYARPSFFNGAPSAGPVTHWLCGLLVGASVLAAVAARSYGVGSTQLRFSAAAVLDGELWRLFTYAFVKSDPLGLLLRTLVLYVFGRLCEGAWGSRDFLRFFLLTSVGGAALAIPITYAVNAVPLPFSDLGMAEGPDAAIDAMMVALALGAPDARMMFGFVLPMPAKNMIFALLGLDVLFGLMTGVATLGMTLGGMVMGYLLVTGNWRPRRLLGAVSSWRSRRRRKSRLYVVPPRRKDHTLN